MLQCVDRSSSRQRFLAKKRNSIEFLLLRGVYFSLSVAVRQNPSIILMDLQAAVIAHLNWKSKLIDFFYGMEDLTLVDMPDHTRCDFDK